MKKNREEIIEYVNSLKSYQGYVQFSDRAITDIFEDFSDISVAEQEGFIYEAHFFNGEESITIKQQNSDWLVSVTPFTQFEPNDIQKYIGINSLKVKMLQIWKEETDSFCEGMLVKKLQKVVFVGFEKGDSK